MLADLTRLLASRLRHPPSSILFGGFFGFGDIVSITLAVVRSNSRPNASATPPVLRSVNDPHIQAIAERVRAVIANQPSHSLDVLSAALCTSPDTIQALVAPGQQPINPALLIDAVAALVRELAIDPQWLLTGRHDPGIHRRALAIAEDRSADGDRAIQQFVRDEYRKLVTCGQ